MVRISTYLNLLRRYILFPIVEDLLYMYAACGFETSSNKKKKSPWCYAFDDDTISVRKRIKYLEAI